MFRRPYINHFQQRNAFKKALNKGLPRLLTIRAGSGKGKSTYIGWAKEECEALNVPVALIDLKAVGQGDVTSVLLLMRHLFRRFRFEVFDAEMAQYTNTRSPSITLRDVHLKESIIGDIIAENPRQRRLIENRLTNALLQDLEIACQHERFVCLWDAFEQSSSEIGTWLATHFSLGACDIPQLITVVAGQNIPSLSPAHGRDKFMSFDLPTSLSWDDWYEYAGEIGALNFINEDVLQRYHKHYHGDPNSMCLICDPFIVEMP